uniref:E2 ubiquitin-conjugating enzyme n=2 Tax=Rhizophora mucronata TaxID=61149 RepID=A0A2P2KKX3_RHIMU
MEIFPSGSDWESSSDSSSSEDTDELEFLYDGKACNILSSLEESIGKIDEFLSFERGFMHGDFVCSVTDPAGQMGRVVKLNLFVDLENIHGRIIKDIDSKKISKIRSISAGDYVVHGPWIGRVDKVIDNVTVLFDDGAKCEMMAEDQDKILPISPSLLEDSTNPYYPGQRVRVKLSTISKTAGWLCGYWKENQNVGTVSAVNAGLLYVDWIACALVGNDLPAPPHVHDAKNLNLLSCFPHESWHLGDWCILPMADCNKVNEQMPFDGSDFDLIQGAKEERSKFRRPDFHLKFREIFIVVKVKTMVDVVWQDGGCSLGLDAQSLLPINIVNAHDFFPGQFVLEKGTCDDLLMPGNQRWGNVCSVDAKERTVNVKWKSTGVNKSSDVSSNQMLETVSAYELVEHPDYSYCYGDIVFKNICQADGQNLSGETGMRKNASPTCESHSRDSSDYASKHYLSCIGCVTDFKDDAVEVLWASGVRNKVAPNDIFRIDKYDGTSTTSLPYEQNVEEPSQELVNHEQQFPSLKGKGLLNSNGVDEEHNECLWVSSSFSRHRSTFGFFTNTAASILRSFGSGSMSGSRSPGHISADGDLSSPSVNEILESSYPCTEMQPLVTGEMQRIEGTSLKREVCEIQANKESHSLSASMSPEQFKQFDMVSDFSDHHFLNGAGKEVPLSQPKRGWLKKVQQEWSILEKDLPESIYVRIYEERMDLIRAAIIGVPETPYHDGLFFFDIYLPPEYPHEPPLVYYHSGGLRINPNLYESGKVCLSLLNTWTGTGNEQWNPESSTILQVLLSIQALVLNEKPYFNEAGYDTQIGRAESEKNSVGYNENAFLVTWRSMLYLVRQPPKHFEALVEEHLRRRSASILLACKEYLEGAPLACAFGCGQAENANQSSSTSTGFKIMLAKLFPRLVNAFASKGIDCHQFIEPEE